MFHEPTSGSAIGRHLFAPSDLEKMTRSLRNSIVHEVHRRMAPSPIALIFEFRICTISRGERAVLGEVDVIIVVMSWIKYRRNENKLLVH